MKTPIRFELTDGLGRVWPLSMAGSCPRLVRGFKGWGRPTMERLERAGSPALHGTPWAGWRATEREVILPLQFAAADLVGAVRDFARGVVPELPGMPGSMASTLALILPDATRWEIDMQLVDDGGLTETIDPAMSGLLGLPLTFDADVFWRGPQWSASWQSAAPVDPWILTSGGVAALSSSYNMSSASATNTGDVRAWPVWTIDGPFTSVSLGIGGQVVTLAYTITVGHQVVIDTDPVVGQMAILDGTTDITSSLTAVDFAPLEPGVETALSITMSGTGSVSISYRPLRLAIL